MGWFGHNWRRRVDDLAGPLPLQHLMGIPMIDLSSNAAFGMVLGAASSIELVLHLRAPARREH